MRSPENILGLLALPVDWMGMIFYPKSKRYVGTELSPEWISAQASQFDLVKKVGVFVNASIEEVLNATHDYQLDFVQLHGDEAPQYCAELQSIWAIGTVREAKLIKAFSVDEAFDFSTTTAYTNYCSYFIFDTKGPGYGGTGKTFSWELLANYEGLTPFLLSGGIDESMTDQIKALNFPQLAGVDINSRFEVEPGVKDLEMVRRFLDQMKV